MPKFEPPFAVKSLDQVSAGALVIFQQAVAFASINPSAPQRIVTLAVHEAASARFVYRYFDAGQPNVLLPGAGEVIIRPNLHSFTENVSVQPASTRLYFKDEPFVVVQLPNGTDIRLLSLKSGSLTTATLSHMEAFTSWEAGVMSLGTFLPLLKI